MEKTLQFHEDDLIVKLRRTTITVTLRCTLRCKLCAIDIPNYTGRLPHYTYDEISKEIDRYFEIVDYVEWLQYSGGEPFLNKELPEMVDKAMKYGDKFDKLMIFTNGTILPDERMIEEFRKHKKKITFFLSHYGNLSDKADEMLNLFEKNDLNYEIKKYYGLDQHCGGWVDYGTWEKRNHTQQELEEIFNNCGMTDMKFSVLQDGLFHLCRRSWRGMNLGVIPQTDTDYLNIFDSTLELKEMKKKINEMMRLRYIQACDYCSGSYTKNNKLDRYPAAEQVTLFGGKNDER